MTEEELCEIVEAAIKQVSDDSFIQLSNLKASFSEIGRSLLSCATKKILLADILKPLILSLQSLMLSGQFGKMWAQFHLIANDKTHCMRITNVISLQDIPEKSCHLFAASLHDTLIKCIAGFQTKRVKRNAKTGDISDCDKGVLYYIAGHLIYALLKKYKGDEKQVFIESMIDSVNKEQDEDVCRWMSYKNRGGLTKPSTDFYNIILYFETVLRKEIQMDSLTSDSLSTCRLRELIISDLSVQQQWNCMAVTINGHNEALLEIFVSYFLKIRGHAVAKVVNELHQKKVATNAKKSLSLRKVLKQKSTSFKK